MALACHRILRNGLIIQWGKGSSSGEDAAASISFTINFTQIPSFFITPKKNDGNWYYFVFTVKTVGTGSAMAVGRAGDRNNDWRQNMDYSWLAIGY